MIVYIGGAIALTLKNISTSAEDFSQSKISGAGIAKICRNFKLSEVATTSV